MLNLYAWFERPTEKLTRCIDEIRTALEQLQKSAGYFPDTPRPDLLPALLETMFPHGLPSTFYVANTSLDPSRVLLALRPAVREGRSWPFPRGRSLCVRGTWSLGNRDPVFLLQSVMEISDAPLRTFERELEVFTYHADPTIRGMRRSDNALTPELVASLPSISQTTQDRLVEWTDYLGWKRNLVREKSIGLRYTDVRVSGKSAFFTVIGPDDETLRGLHGPLHRQQVSAFSPSVSTDPWTLKLDDKGRTRPNAFELGDAKGIKRLNGTPTVEGCPWRTLVAAEFEVELADGDQDALQASEERDVLAETMAKQMPKNGFVAVPVAGDLALIARHERALQELRDQGGYAPYLSAYLFDVMLANLPDQTDLPTTWHRSDLNPHQRQAVAKILAAPDLCLIQGPPGTGKTTVIAEATWQLVQRGKKVLLASQAHTAVDNALERLGNVPEIRAIRLGKTTKISDAGQAFAEDRILQRYYRAIADACEGRHLKPWKDDTRALATLKQWHDRAQFAWTDHERDRASATAHASRRPALRAALQQEEQALANRRRDNENRELTRTRLANLVHALNGTEAGPVDLPEPEATSLVHEVTALSGVGIKLPANAADWEAARDARGALLAALARRWKEVEAQLEPLRNDVERLKACGKGPLRDPAIGIRLAAVEERIRAVDAALETDDTLLGQWKELRRERTELQRAGGGLDAQFYDRLLTDGTAVVEATTDASVALKRVRAVVRAIEGASSRIAVASWKLSEHAAKLERNAAPLPVSLTDLHQCEAALAAHDRDTVAADKAVSQRETILDGLWKELRALAPSRFDAAAFDLTMNEVRTELKTLQQRLAATQDARARWTGLLTDWVHDLRSVDTQAADQQPFIRTYMEHCNVVAITCNENSRTLEQSNHAHFDVAIVDEVSKATPTELLLPLMRARTAVLVGDHRQLPPLFKESNEAISWVDALDEDGDASRTALTHENLQRYKRMVTASLFKEHFERAPEAIRERLEVQFRMHPQIMSLVNHFYERRLTCGLRNPDVERHHGLTIPAHDGRPLLTSAHHAVWFDSSHDPSGRPVYEDTDGDGRTLRTNRMEAILIAEMLMRLDEASVRDGWSKDRRRKVGVVSFYAHQLRMIKDEIGARLGQERNFRALEVEVNTVIRYQGKEKPIVLVSLVRNIDDGRGDGPARSGGRRRRNRSNVAQYQFINVAFSRAQELLIVFGAKRMFEELEVELPKMDQEGTYERPVYRDILQDLSRQGRLFQTDRLLAPSEYARRIASVTPQHRRRR